MLRGVCPMGSPSNSTSAQGSAVMSTEPNPRGSDRTVPGAGAIVDGDGLDVGEARAGAGSATTGATGAGAIEPTRGGPAAAPREIQTAMPPVATIAAATPASARSLREASGAVTASGEPAPSAAVRGMGAGVAPVVVPAG